MRWENKMLAYEHFRKFLLKEILEKEKENEKTEENTPVN